MSKYPCTGCGACCMIVAPTPEFSRGDGLCIHFVNQKCDIYETRPDICRVDFELNGKGHGFKTEKDYFEASAIVCRYLIKHFGIDPKYHPIIQSEH